MQHGAYLTIEELEAGLRIMRGRNVDLDAFWEEHLDSFRRTLLVAVRDTTDALLSPTISLAWRLDLEKQLEALVGYIEIAERYAASRRIKSSVLPVRSSARAHQFH